LAGIIYSAGTGNIGGHNVGQQLHIKDFYHSRAELEMAGDGPGPQIDHPKPAAELVAIGYDGDSFERLPGFGEPDEGKAAVEARPRETPGTAATGVTRPVWGSATARSPWPVSARVEIIVGSGGR